ncbi:MAG: phosphotransferase [Asgard group archaeon]|nr:phosphotransferase [Asgard group archaeon]
MILTNQLVKEIIKNNYNLGDLVSICLLESGHESDNVKITSEKGDFVVKYFPREPDNIRESFILQDLLFSKGIKLAKPIKTKSDDFVVEYSPTETIVVQSFVNGEAIVFRDVDPEKMFNLMRWFGKHLGEYHFLSKSINESEIRTRITREDFYDRSSGLDWLKEQYSKAGTQLPSHDKNEYVLKEFEKYLKEMDEIFNSNLSLGIVHTDLKPGDFFVESDKLTGILDFNGAFYTYLMSELGTWIMYTSLFKPENKVYFQDFIKPYLEHSKIPLEELRYLPAFFKERAFVQFFYFAYRIHNNITQGLSEGETNIEGFEDGIDLVEACTSIESDYFYKLAKEILENE